MYGSLGNAAKNPDGFLSWFKGLTPTEKAFFATTAASTGSQLFAGIAAGKKAEIEQELRQSIYDEQKRNANYIPKLGSGILNTVGARP